MAEQSKLLLIDGHSILNRAFYGLPDLTNSKGQHTNAVYGFLNILFKTMEEEKPDHLTVAFDLSAPTFRHRMFADYKGTRKPMAAELREQVPMIKEMLAAMGICLVTKEGLEADDLLGTMSKIGEAAGMDVTILSGDRDLLQLATDKVKIMISKTKKGGTETESYYAKDVRETYQVSPTEFIDVKALWGDTADNIPGVPGIGEKTATNIIAAYGSIEAAHEHAEDLKPPRAARNIVDFWDQARLSKTLATIDVHAKIDYDLAAAQIGNIFTDDAYRLCKDWGFKNILLRFDKESVDREEKDLTSRFSHLTSRTAFEEMIERAGQSQETWIGAGLFLKDHSAARAGQIRALAISFEGKAFFAEADTEARQLSLFGSEADDGSGDLIQSTDLRRGLQALADAGKNLAFLDLKEALSQLSFSDRGRSFDLQVAAYLLDPLSSSYPTEDIARDQLALSIPSYSEFFGKKKADQIWEDPEEVEHRMHYACYQAYVASRAPQKLLKRLEEQGMRALYEEVELPLVYTLYDMETAGIAVEKEALKSYGDQLVGRIKELEEGIYREAGETFNINSPKQLGEVLFGQLGLPGARKTKTGYSTAADVLDPLGVNYQIVRDVLEFRQLTKLKSTYADGLAKVIADDGRIHSSFQQTVTATGRLSSTEPNLQNIPIRMELGKEIRRVFPAMEGCVFVDSDYSQIELRVLAHLSQDPKLIEAYRQGKDIHRATASLVFHTPFEEVTDQQRSNAKAVNFGIVYGISAFGLAKDLGISREEAQEYIDGYFAAYPRLHDYLDGLVEFARKEGYAVTLFGRRRPVPELKNSNFMQRQFGERVAMNAPVQGTAADIIKIAMVRVHDRLAKEGLRSRLILTVHDELLVETFEQEEQEVREILDQEMRGAAQLSVELEIDTHSGRNWYDAK